MTDIDTIRAGLTGSEKGYAAAAALERVDLSLYGLATALTWHEQRLMQVYQEHDQKVEQLNNQLSQSQRRLREALTTIAGPEDSGPFIEVYRAAGGGYQGLQAIAAAALAPPDPGEGP